MFNWLIFLPPKTFMQKASVLLLVLPNITFRRLLTNSIREAGEAGKTPGVLCQMMGNYP